MLLCPDSHGWLGSFPRHFELGQSAEVLSSRGSELWNPKAKMTVETLLRDWQSEAMSAVMKFPNSDLDLTEAEVTKIKKIGRRNLTLSLTNNFSLQCERAIFCTGVGPEMDLTASGVTFWNYPTGPRVTLNETTTALKAIAQPNASFRGQSVLVYGGGATAAWVAEIAIANGAKDVRWVAERGFEGANPGGRNNEVMALTKDVRRNGKIKTIKYMGDLASGSGLEAVLALPDTGKSEVWKSDRIIAATGSNPLASTGILSVLGLLYQELQPVHRGGGFFACDSDASIIVTSTPLSFDSVKFGSDFKSVLVKLPEEARVPAGILTARLSATAVAEFVAEEQSKVASVEKETKDK